jgi:hypothetical protein
LVSDALAQSPRKAAAMPALSSKLIALVAGFVFIGAATPADAAKKHKHAKHKIIVAARSTKAPAHRGADKFPVGPLYYNGDVYLGDDPDPFIRLQLWRDLGARFGGESD